ncbi:MAG: zinc ribbon domain-containing protein [Clostridia bacterium]|nr:zinc ribbon domain-containing protein [Clostridia bacterium]
MICEKCGSNLPDNYKFCLACGAPLMAAEPAPAVQPKPCFTAAPDLSTPNVSDVPAEQGTAPLVSDAPQMPAAQQEDDGAPVIVAEESFFSQSSAEQAPAPQPAPVPLMQVMPATEQVPTSVMEADPVPAAPEAAPEKKKKSHTGLIIAIAAAAVIAIGVLIAGFLTDWFRAEKKQGPMDEIKAVCEATFPEDCANGTVNLKIKLGGMSFDIPIQFDIDRDDPENSALYAEINILGQRMELGLYQGKLILSSNGNVEAEELGTEFPEISIGSLKMKDGKYDTESFCREMLDEEEFEEIAEEIDFERLDEALQELEDHFNDEAWLEEFCGYTREKEDDTVTYSFTPAPELAEELMRIFSPAYKGEEPLDAADFELPENMEIALVAVKGKLDKIEIELEVEGQSLELEISFEKIGKTKVDRDALSDLLDEAEEEYYW